MGNQIEENYMKPSFNNNKIRYSYEWRTNLVIVLMIIIVLLTSFVFLYRNTVRLTNNSRQLLESQLDNIANSFQNEYYNFYNIFEILSVNNTLHTVASYSKSTSNTDFVQDSVMLRRILMSYSSIDTPCLNTIAVYFPKSSSVVTMSRTVNANEINLFFGDYPEIAPEILEQNAYTNYQNNYRIINENHNWIVRKVIINNDDTAYILIQYNIDDLVRHNILGVKDAYISIGTADECIYSNSVSVDLPEYQRIRREAEDSGEFKLDGTYIAKSVHTKFQDIRCIIGIPLNTQVTIRRLLVSVILLASFSTLLGFVTLLLNLRYKILNPLESLLARHSINFSKQDKIITSVTSSYHEMEKDHALLKRERDYLIPLAMGRYLERLSEAADAEKAAAIAESCLTLINLSDTGNVAVFAICCVSDKNQHLDSFISSKTVSITTLHFLLDNVLKELLFDQYPGTIAPLGKTSFAVIVDCDDRDLDFIDKQVNQLISFFRSKVDTELITISTSLCSSPSEFADAILYIYREISFFTFWETKTDIKDDPGEITGFYQSCLRIRQIISALTEDNVDESFSQMDQLVRGIIHYEDSQNAKYRLYALTTYIVAAIDQYRGKDDSTGYSGRFEHRLYEARTITDYIEQMHSIILEVLKSKESIDRTTFISSRMNDIKEYIQEHFRENSLTVASIAAQFGISVSYLSRSFKSTYEINLLEYIQRLRVNEAKKLLCTETVQNVAREVGFWDTQALIRSFKKLEGVNPGVYKRLIEDEHEWV